MFYLPILLCMLLLLLQTSAFISKERWASEFYSRLSRFENNEAFRQNQEQSQQQILSLVANEGRQLWTRGSKDRVSFAVFFKEPASTDPNANAEAQKRHDSMRKAIKKASGHYQHISKTAGLVSITPSEAKQLSEIAFVEEVVPFVGEMKVHRDVSCSEASEEQPVGFNFMTSPSKEEELENVLQRLESAGVGQVVRDRKQIFKTTNNKETRQFGRLTSLTSPQLCEKALQAIKSESSVEWVEHYTPNRILNKWATYSSQGGGYNYYTPIWDAGLTGSGQIIGISDTGLDVNHGFFYDSSHAVPYNSISSTHRKIVTYITSVDSTDADAGHGTHVCGTAMGNTNNGDSYKGSAYDAKVAFVDIGDASEALTTPADINIDLYANMYAAGARIMSSSWGSSTNTYTTDTFNSDSFMFSNPDALVLYAAGNDGSNGEGSIVSPSVGKNVVSVGASLNDYPSWKSVTGTTSTGKYNVGSVAYFSSQGPTSNNLLKPDVLGQGYYVKSSKASSSSSAGHTSTTLKAGTSMATPLTAGNAALMRQYFTEGYYPSGKAIPSHAFTPSAALLKAALVHSGQEMDGLLSSTGSLSTISFPGYQQGYGRVQLDKVLDLDNSYSTLVWGATDDASKVLSFANVGDNYTMVFNMTSELQFLRDFKVTMAYTDEPVYPGDASLTNDIDLLVTYEGVDYYPSWTTPSADSTNTLEQIIIPSPTANSTVKVTVSCTSKLGSGSQEIGLVISGAFSGYSYNASMVFSGDDIGQDDLVSFLNKVLTVTNITYAAPVLLLILLCCIYKKWKSNKDEKRIRENRRSKHANQKHTNNRGDGQVQHEHYEHQRHSQGHTRPFKRVSDGPMPDNAVDMLQMMERGNYAHK